MSAPEQTSEGTQSPPPTSAPAAAAGGNPRFVLHPDDNFDFATNRGIERPTNVFESMIHLMKGCLGGGIMGVHVAYKNAGLWVGLGFTFFFGAYISYCVFLIVHSAQAMYRRLHVTSLSYPDLAEASVQCCNFPKIRKFSKTFRYIVDICICFNLFGSCAVYEIMIARTIVQLVRYFKDMDIVNEKGEVITDIASVRIYVAVILIPILLLCMIRSLKYLAPFSLVANVFVLMTVFTTIYYGASEPSQPLDQMPIFGTWPGFFEYAGVVVFSMEGVGVCLPIENNMKTPTKFPVALFGGMIVVISFVCCVGFFGYWGYGPNCKAPVTLNFPLNTYPTILKGLMAAMIYVTFALNFWAPFNLVWFYISKKYPPDKHWIWERVYRVIIIIIITLLAIAFPSITSFMGLLGGFCVANMGFIFPPFIDILIIYPKPGLGPGMWKLYKNIIIMLGGFTLFLTSTYFNAKSLMGSGAD